MRRGDVWWAKLPKPMGQRPVVLVSRDEAYRIRTSVTVALVTTTIRHIRTEIPLGLEDGLPKSCVVNLDDLFTVEKSRLRQFIAHLSSEKMAMVDAAITFALALS